MREQLCAMKSEDLHFAPYRALTKSNNLIDLHQKLPNIKNFLYFVIYMIRNFRGGVNVYAQKRAFVPALELISFYILTHMIFVSINPDFFFFLLFWTKKKSAEKFSDAPKQFPTIKYNRNMTFLQKWGVRDPHTMTRSQDIAFSSDFWLFMGLFQAPV